VEKNKGQLESRTLVSSPLAAEDLGFPWATQAALLTRQRQGQQSETVGLITDLSEEELPAPLWLRSNRSGWGIENGSHLRLDVSLNDDLCRVRKANALWILGMLRRVVVSFYMHWRSRQRRPQSLWLPDFQADMGENNLAKAMALVTNRHPKLA